MKKANKCTANDPAAKASRVKDGEGAQALKLVPASNPGPWLGKDGRRLPEGRLRQRSEKWSLETWRRYADHLDSMAVDPIEYLTSDMRIEDELRDETYEMSETPDRPKPDYDQLHRAIESLDSVRRTVIRLIYFDGLTVREVAKRLGCPRSTVHDLKSSSLSTLKSQFPDKSTLVGGKIENFGPLERRKTSS